VTALRVPPSASDPDVGPVLCAAASALLVIEGIAGLDAERVDEEADLPPGTCAGRYHSRAELIAAMLESEAAGYWSAFDAIVAKHRGDRAAALAAWVAFLMGPGRARTSALWAIGFDAGTRRESNMYVNALLAGWDREIAKRFGLTPRQLRLAWPMVEGWAMHGIVRDAPPPDVRMLREQFRALLDRTA